MEQLLADAQELLVVVLLLGRLVVAAQGRLVRVQVDVVGSECAQGFVLVPRSLLQLGSSECVSF